MLHIWKDIAVFLDATAEGEQIGRHAAALARRHGAHLVGIYSVSRSRPHPAETYARGSAAIGSVMTRQRVEDEKKAVAAARRFGELALKYGISSEFRIVWRDAAGDSGALRALHCDLIVAAHPWPAELPTGWSAERLLLITGTPVVVVPGGWQGETIGDNVLIAWNRSREARRAVNDAIPFITSAAKVTILTVDSDRDPELYGVDPGANLLEHLARHGSTAEIASVSSEGTSVAGTILDEAANRGANLLIIGAYSHPRTTEILFGGVTRTLLASAQLPLLISR